MEPARSLAVAVAVIGPKRTVSAAVTSRSAPSSAQVFAVAPFAATSLHGNLTVRALADMEVASSRRRRGQQTYATTEKKPETLND